MRGAGRPMATKLALAIAGDRVKFAYKGEEIPVFLDGKRKKN